MVPQGAGKYKKQSGGKGQYGDTWLERALCQGADLNLTINRRWLCAEHITAVKKYCGAMNRYIPVSPLSI
jgi:hypothetical protein